MIPQPATRTETMAFEDWLLSVDDAITETIVDSYRYGAWKEDSITHAWLTALMKNFQDVTIADVDIPFTVSWKAYKADGKVEESYGDVCVIVDFQLQTKGKRAHATGVGFLEAKRLDEKSKNYSNMGWPQLKKESDNIASHRVLLYDFESIEGSSLNLQTYGFCPHLNSAPYGAVNASVAITQHVVALQDRSREVGAIGVPLGYQICARYLRGLDLDYSLDPAVFLAGMPERLPYLLIANVQTLDNTLEPTRTPVPAGYGPIRVKPDEEARDETVYEALIQGDYGLPSCLDQNPSAEAQGSDEEEAEGLVAMA